jgi:hypothetical protein
MAQRAGEKSGEAGISGRRWWNLVLKSGFDLNAFWNVSMSNGIFRDGHVSGSAGGRHRGGDFRPDGERVGSAAANRQFRLGRHHLDLFARPGRRQNRVRRRDEIERVLRWFFLATAGLFGYAGGSEWGVSH